jgi:hypothetical protein
MIHLATKTVAAINEAIAADQGAQFRVHLGQILPHITDAYRGKDEGFRSHLGASLIGGVCDRKLWYGFRWASKPNFDGRILRLFNRGHLEEGRFIAMLLTINVQFWQQDTNGNQFRVSDAGGHFGGSTDGVALGIPDLDPTMPCLTEFKTHNDSSFKKLKKEGVQATKFEHYVQMQIYMKKLGLTVALYLAVNKNDDEVYGELVYLDNIIADRFINRGITLVFLPEAPAKINTSPGWFDCKFCDHRNVCHLSGDVEKNCRTCDASEPCGDGSWLCKAYGHAIPKEVQLTGCSTWERKPSL